MIDVASNPFAADLVLHRVFSLFEPAGTDPELNDTSRIDASERSLADLAWSDGRTLAVDETVALRPYHSPVRTLALAAPTPLLVLLPSSSQPHGSVDIPSTLGPSRLCRLLC
jgi:hypothetical protein